MNRLLIALAVAALPLAATAQTALDLSRYRLSATYDLDTLNQRGLEASAVTYARDRGSLFFVGDEGLGVVEVSRTGQTLGSMAFTWPAASSNNDAEGLAYLGNGRLVVAEERLQDLFQFDFVDGGTAALQSAPFVSLGPTIGNVGIEGVAVDLRNAADPVWFAVKQDNPQAFLRGPLTFSATGGTSGMSEPFNADAVLGLASLSDVATLSGVDTLASAPAGDNVLVLSLDSRRLVEVNRNTGVTLSQFDLASITSQAIEGVTIDETGTVFLVAESSAASPSKLIVLTPIPEPSTWAFMAGGLLMAGALARRRANR